MLLGAAGLYGTLLLALLLVGLLVQSALGALYAMGRRVPVGAALSVPALALAVGGLGMGAELGAAVEAARTGADAAWLPWFALQDRGRAAAAAVVGAAVAATLLLPVTLGAAAAAARSGPRAWGRAGAVAGTAALATALVAGLGVRAGLGAGALGPSLVLLAVGVAAGAAQLHPVAGRWTVPAVGVGAAVAGSAAVGTWLVARAAFAGMEALPDFDAPFARVGSLDRAAATLDAVPGAVLPGLLLLAAAALAALLGRPPARLDRASALDAAWIAALALLTALAWARVPLGWFRLAGLAGEPQAALLDARPGYDLPHRAVVPPRVLVADPAGPRWIATRSGGGAERTPVPGPLEVAFAGLATGDGLVLPPSLPLDELYFALAEADAGELALIGCAEVPADLWRRLRLDPLRAAGRCGALPVGLRATPALQDPRVLIVLKDREVDDGGDVVPVEAVGDLAGRAVLVRAQLDATVDDLVALLRRLADAGPVFLGWGVQVDGEDLPVGVNPGLRAVPPSPNGQAADAPIGE